MTSNPLNQVYAGKAIWELALYESFDVIKSLIGAGMDINSVNAQGRTLLWVMCDYGCHESSQRCNNWRQTRFDWDKFFEIFTIENIEWLLEHGADPTLKDNEGLTLINWLAILLGNDAFEFDYSRLPLKQLIGLLIKHGVNVDEPCGGKPPLLFACRMVINDLCTALLENGADAKFLCKDGKTYLHHYMRQCGYVCFDHTNNKPTYKNSDIVPMILKFIQYGTDPYIMDQYGKEAYDYIDDPSERERIRKEVMTEALIQIEKSRHTTDEHISTNPTE